MLLKKQSTRNEAVALTIAEFAVALKMADKFVVMERYRQVVLADN